VLNNKVKEYLIHTSIEWSCKKNEQDIDGKGEEYAQWCRLSIIILGRGSGYCMLLGKSITYISIG